MKIRMLLAAAGSFALLACSEIPQDAPKPFAGKEETRSYESALADRARTQDEYLTMEDAKKAATVAAK